MVQCSLKTKKHHHMPRLKGFSFQHEVLSLCQPSSKLYCSSSPYKPSSFPSALPFTVAGHQQKHRKGIKTKKKVNKNPAGDNIADQHHNPGMLYCWSQNLGLARHAGKFFYCISLPSLSWHCSLISGVIDDQQFWRRMMDTYSLKNRSTELVGAATLLSWHISWLSRRVSLTEELSALLHRIIFSKGMWWVPATSCVEAFNTLTASWRVEKGPREWPEQLIQEHLATPDWQQIQRKYPKIEGFDVPSAVQDPLRFHFPDYLYCCKTRSMEISVPSLSLPFPATLQKQLGFTRQKHPQLKNKKGAKYLSSAWTILAVPKGGSSSLRPEN